MFQTIVLLGLALSLDPSPLPASGASESGQDVGPTMAKARGVLNSVPSCAQLAALQKELGAVRAPNQKLAAANLEVLREEVRVRLLPCGKTKTHTSASSPTDPRREQASALRPSVAGPVHSASRTSKKLDSTELAAFDGSWRTLQDASQACNAGPCLKEAEAFAEDLLRLALTIYAQAEPSNPLLPQLRERLGKLLLKHLASQALVEQLKVLIDQGKVTPEELATLLGSDAVISALLTFYRQHGLELLVNLLRDPAGADAVAGILRRGRIDRQKLEVIVEAGVDGLYSAVQTTEDRERFRRGLELATQLADPRTRRNLLAAAIALRARSQNLDKFVKTIERKELDAATAQALAQKIDRVTWNELAENRAAIERWESTDPRASFRRILPVILEPPRQASITSAQSTEQPCEPLQRFSESYFRFLYSAGRLMPRPPLPLGAPQAISDVLLKKAEPLLAKNSKTWRDTCTTVDNQPKVPEDEFERSLCLRPIGVIVATREMAGGGTSPRAGIAWLLQTGSGRDDWLRQTDPIYSAPLPSSCTAERDRDAIDAEAVRVAIDTSQRMSLVSQRVHEAFTTQQPQPKPSPYGALLFAGLPYIRDPEAPRWARWVTSGADVAGLSTSIATLVWSAKLRNDYSNGRTGSLEGANAALRIGIGAAIGVAVVRLISGVAYYWEFADNR